MAAIATHLTKSGLPSHPEEILVTHGAQEAIGLAASLFLSPGRVVGLEDPTYVGAHDRRAWGLAALGRYDEAIAENPSAPVNALLLSRVGRYHEAGQAIDVAARAAAANASERGIPVFEDDARPARHGPPPPRPSLARALGPDPLSRVLQADVGGLRAGGSARPGAHRKARPEKAGGP